MKTLILFMSLVTLTTHGRETNKTGGVWLNTCTAVYVAPNMALTAAHCVANVEDGKMWGRTDDGQSYSLSVLRENRARDVALLHVDGPPHFYAKLADNSPQKGDKVYLISSEQGMVGTYGEGIVANILIDAELNYTPMIVHTAAIKPGASGSGLFNSNGELIGINTITMGALSEAVELLTLRHMLENQAQFEALQPK